MTDDRPRTAALAQERPHRIHTIYTQSSSCYTIPMDSRRIIAELEKAGWFHVATKGDHWQFKHMAHPGRVTVPHPKRDLPLGTLRSIEKQSGLKLR